MLLRKEMIFSLFSSEELMRVWTRSPSLFFQDLHSVLTVMEIWWNHGTFRWFSLIRERIYRVITANCNMNCVRLVKHVRALLENSVTKQEVLSGFKKKKHLCQSKNDEFLGFFFALIKIYQLFRNLKIFSMRYVRKSICKFSPASIEWRHNSLLRWQIHLRCHVFLAAGLKLQIWSLGVFIISLPDVISKLEHLIRREWRQF